MQHLVIGLVAIALGIWGLIAWWKSFGMVMRGVVPFCLVVFGLVAVMSGFRRFSSNDEQKNKGLATDNEHTGTTT